MLAAGATVRADRELDEIAILERRIQVIAIVAVARLRRVLPGIVLVVVRVVLVVDVHRAIRPEVDRVGTERPPTFVLVGIEHLYAKRLPPAGRSSRHHARPRLADAAELLLDVRNEIVGDGIAV